MHCAVIVPGSCRKEPEREGFEPETMSGRVEVPASREQGGAQPEAGHRSLLSLPPCLGTGVACGRSERRTGGDDHCIPVNTSIRRYDRKEDHAEDPHRAR